MELKVFPETGGFDGALLVFVPPLAEIPEEAGPGTLRGNGQVTVELPAGLPPTESDQRTRGLLARIGESAVLLAC